MPVLLAAVGAALAAEPAPPGRWGWEPYVVPLGGFTIYSGTGGSHSAGSLGLAGGVRYWDREGPLQGESRLAGTYLTSASGGESGWGLDVRLGSFIGPHWKYGGVTTGLDGFYNRYSSGGLELEPTFGVDLPVQVTGRLNPFAIFAGVETAWVSNPARRVDWSETDAFGFGHEFGWNVGASARIEWATFSVRYSHRVLATGVSQGVSGSVQLAR